MTLLLLAQLACVDADDSGDTAPADDSGDTATTPVSLNDLLAGPETSAWGCRWAYMVSERDAAGFVADLHLLEADRYANLDVHYTRALEAGESLTVGGGTGTDDFAVFDCSDVFEVEQGVHVWQATSATIDLVATYVEDRPEWTCYGTGPNPVYDAQLTVVDATFEDAGGARGTLTDWGPLAVQIGMDFCGG